MSCNSQTLAGLAKDCTPSWGGIKQVLIANHADVTGVTVTESEISAITMASTAKFKKYEFRAGTGSMTSTATIDKANGVQYFTTEVALQFNRMETTKRIEITALAANDLVVIVQDANGKYFYLGHDEPVTASAADGQTGIAKSDANKYGITLQDNSKELPFEVAESVIADLVA